MKGIETMPVKLILVCLLLFIVVSVGYLQVNTFLTFKSQKDLKSSITGLVQQMRVLKSGGDQGAFTGVWMDVPSQYRIVLDLDNDIITGEMGPENYTVDLKELAIDLTAYKSGALIYRGGAPAIPGGSSYEFRVYFGSLTGQEMADLKYTLVFT